MNCPRCGTSLPDQAQFCFRCGSAVQGGGPSSPPPPPGGGSSSGGGIGAQPSGKPIVGAAGAQEMHCPSCGGPLHPVFGEMVITCDYCGGCVTLGGAGWKEIDKHTILPPRVTSRDAALATVHNFLDVGLLHRKAFEESTITEAKLSFVPFWILPVAATTNYTYTDVAVSVGSTVGTIAAAELLGSALGGRRGGFVPVVIPTGPTVNPTRQDTIASNLEYPIVAVKAMGLYQPKNYAFDLTERTFFDKKVIPEGSPVLNGDLGEDAAQHSARSFVTQLQSEEAHRRHHMVSGLTTEVQVSEGELLHVPVWYFVLDRKGQKTTILVDGHSNRVMTTVQ